MAEYINKEELLKKAKEIDSIFALPLIIREIENAPVEDVVEIKHAEWLLFSCWSCWYCSNCGFTQGYGDEWEWCPNCGSRMDLE